MGLAFWLQRGAVVGWVSGLFVLALAVGSLSREVADMARDNPTLSDYLEVSDASQPFRLAGLVLVYAPASLALAALAVAWAALGVCFVLGWLGGLLNPPRWLEQLWSLWPSCSWWGRASSSASAAATSADRRNHPVAG